MGSRYYIEDWGSSSIQNNFDDEELANGEVKIIEMELLLGPVNDPKSVLEKILEDCEKPETRKVRQQCVLNISTH